MYRLSPEAQADIDDIWDSIAQDKPSAADRFTASLSEKFSVLARQPRIGRLCDELRPGLHRFPVGNYLTFYRIRSRKVEIVRVLHGARDIEAIFDPEGEP
jgi:toxin ParE1/3/4